MLSCPQAHHLITDAVFIALKATDEFQHTTTAINQLWQTRLRKLARFSDGGGSLAQCVKTPHCDPCECTDIDGCKASSPRDEIEWKQFVIQGLGTTISLWPLKDRSLPLWSGSQFHQASSPLRPKPTWTRSSSSLTGLLIFHAVALHTSRHLCLQLGGGRTRCIAVTQLQVFKQRYLFAVFGEYCIKSVFFQNDDVLMNRRVYLNSDGSNRAATYQRSS